jgi:hypothetical protein
VHQAAHILADEGDRSVEELRRDYRRLLCEMSARKEQAGALSGAVSLFLKVTKSYWKGLFRCYRFPNLPRTNNDLEHCFGSARYHERRASGRRNASPAMVVRGSVRVVAAVATPRTYAQLMLRDGALCGLRWRRDERAAVPSYASGETQMPTFGGLKSSYSSSLCRPSFLSGNPSRLNARLTVAVEAFTPWDSSKNPRCSSRVRSRLARS